MHSFIQELTSSGRKALGYGVLVAALSVLILTAVLGEPRSVVESPKPEPVVQEPQPVVRTDPFDAVRLEAASAYVLDVSSGDILYEKNATARYPLASITKIMSAVTATDLMPQYTVVTITDDALILEGDNGLYGQERWTIEDLLDFSLVASSNDAMGAIASVAGAISGPHTTSTFQENVDLFVQAMNQKAREIGLEDTRFMNPHGLDTDEFTSGSYGTARDTAALMQYALKEYPGLLESTGSPFVTSTSLSGITHVATNTNDVVDQIPGLLASKTGFTDLSGGNLVVAFDAGLNRPMIAVVLGSSYNSRFDDMLQLVEASVSSVADVTRPDEPVL
ncbi:MAG: hypothetical protein WD049_04635 [Candidatus Paceibacterota bacterium]